MARDDAGMAAQAAAANTAQATTTTTTAAPEPWTMDAAVMWVVATFYVAVVAAAAVYFVKRWRRRAYAAGSASPSRSAGGGREERTALRSGGTADGSDGGFLATIGAMIDRVMNRAALDGAAAWQSSGSNSHRKPGAGNTLLRKIAPYLPGAQGRAAAARRNKEKDETPGDAVEVEVSSGAGVRPDGTPATRTELPEMTEEVGKPSSPDVPFASSPLPVDGTRGSSDVRLSSGSILGGGAGGAKPAATAGKSAHSASFTSAAGDADPYALLQSIPAHTPPSLAHRAYGTETLFQYYTQRGFKELLIESNSADAGKAVQTCLDGKADTTSTAVGEQSEMNPSPTQKKTQPKNTHVIDRCLAEGPAGVPTPLRPPQVQDKNSLYLSQQADEARAQVKAQRRAHLRQPPTASAYVGRYYPTGVDVLPSVHADGGAAGGAAASSSSGIAVRRRSHSNSLSHSASLIGPAARSPGLPPATGNGSGGRPSGSARLEGGLAGRTPSLVVPLRTPEEVAAQAEQQKEVRRLLSQQIDEAFLATFRLRESIVAEGRAGSAKKRASTAASRVDSATKRKSIARAASTAAAGPAATTAATGLDGTVPANLSLFSSSLLLLSNEDGAVTLDQLCAMAADVPFNVSAASAGAASGNAVQRLFRVLHPNTRAPNAADATDLLLAVASVTGPGGVAGRQAGGGNDTSVSYAATTTAAGGNTSTMRAGNSATALTGTNRRPMGTSVSSVAGLGGSPNRGPRSSILGISRGAGSPTGTVAHLPTASVSFASNAHSQKNHPPIAGAAWKEASSPLGPPGRQQSAQGAPSELKDSRKCVLVMEVLDALDALLNSPETRRVVRWECFAVLAGEGHGYIHTSQLVLLRRHAYRDGSAVEANAAVTASMVRALEDAFHVIATEEEAAYLKANKKGRKGGGEGGAAASLNSNQKSAIPLHMMRKSHMDFPLFCRFFDELPQMPAAFAHVWLPLLLEGARRQSLSTSSSPLPPPVANEEEESVSCSPARSVPADSANAGDGEGVDGGDGPSTAVDVRGAKDRPPSKSISAPVATDGDENGFPLELLGGTPSVRQAMIQRLLTRRMEQLQEACDALEREKLQDETSTGSGAFGSPDSIPVP